jgi:TonB family protein
MSRLAAFVVLLAANFLWVADARGDLQRDVRQAYTGKILSLRVPSNYDILHFDAQGQPTRPGSGEPWTTCGLFRVKKVTISPNQMGIDGERVVVVLNSEAKGPKITLASLDRYVHIAIDLSPSTRTAKDIDGLLARILLSGDLQGRAAAAWSSNVDLNGNLDDIGKSQPDGRIGSLADGRPVYVATAPPTKPPVAVFKPGPKYSEKALFKRVAGTIRVRMVVNEDGYPEILEVIQHLHEGLDNRALAAVAQWRFKPALRDGNPVAAMLIVDVKFRLR